MKTKITKEYYQELINELELRKAIRASAVKAEADAWREMLHDTDDESRRKEVKDQ